MHAHVIKLKLSEKEKNTADLISHVMNEVVVIIHVIFSEIAITNKLQCIRNAETRLSRCTFAYNPNENFNEIKTQLLDLRRVKKST